MGWKQRKVRLVLSDKKVSSIIKEDTFHHIGYLYISINNKGGYFKNL